MVFRNTIITQDEYYVSETSSGGKATDSHAKSGISKGAEGSFGKMDNKMTIMEIPVQVQSDSESKIKNSKAKKSTRKNAAVKKKECLAVKTDNVNETMLKPFLKSVGAKKVLLSVTWADDRNDSADSKNLCEIRELENKEGCTDKFSVPNRGDDNDLVRFASAEACVMALSQAAEAVATGDFDASDAVSEAGIIVLQPPMTWIKNSTGMMMICSRMNQHPSSQQKLESQIIIYLNLRILGLTVHRRDLA